MALGADVMQLVFSYLTVVDAVSVSRCSKVFNRYFHRYVNTCTSRGFGKCVALIKYFDSKSSFARRYLGAYYSATHVAPEVYIGDTLVARIVFCKRRDGGRFSAQVAPKEAIRQTFHLNGSQVTIQRPSGGVPDTRFSIRSNGKLCGPREGNNWLKTHSMRSHAGYASSSSSSSSSSTFSAMPLFAISDWYDISETLCFVREPTREQIGTALGVSPDTVQTNGIRATVRALPADDAEARQSLVQAVDLTLKFQRADSVVGGLTFQSKQQEQT